jgi:hypothetical protein
MSGEDCPTVFEGVESDWPKADGTLPPPLVHVTKDRPRPARNIKKHPGPIQTSTDVEERVIVDEPTSPAPQVPR